MIKQNDFVLLEYGSYFNFPPKYGDKERFIEARVIHIPNDTGDFWIFESLEFDLQFYQNPMDSNFLRIYKLEEYYATKKRQITESDF